MVMTETYIFSLSLIITYRQDNKMNLKKIDHQAGDIILTCRQVKSLWKIFGSTTKDDYNAFTYFKDIKIVQAVVLSNLAR